MTNYFCSFSFFQCRLQNISRIQPTPLFTMPFHSYCNSLLLNQPDFILPTYRLFLIQWSKAIFSKVKSCHLSVQNPTMSPISLRVKVLIKNDPHYCLDLHLPVPNHTFLLAILLNKKQAFLFTCCSLCLDPHLIAQSSSLCLHKYYFFVRSSQTLHVISETSISCSLFLCCFLFCFYSIWLLLFHLTYHKI